MKNLLLLFSLLLVLNSCSNDDDGASLPAETQIGANTVGCLVNGEVFLPHAEGINPPVNCFYQFVDGEFFFTMNFADLRGVTNERVVIQTGRIDLQKGQTYILNKNTIDDGDFSGGGGVYSLSLSNRFNTNTILTGELKMSRIDLQNSIISGTFWFDAINDSGEVVEIRQGRFDWNY
ncbi:DUF6252 family protein [Algibacter sp. AS12]|uniref:DUF6252 family protein n=1 Tax=Algibacter sp. AS12 TaxID=3135773 RepID=UPI00398B6A4B